jgi:hypothetical protein
MKHLSGQTRSELAAKRLQNSSFSATDSWPIFTRAKYYSSRLALSSWSTLHAGVTELFRHIGWSWVIGGKSHHDRMRQVSIRNEQRFRSDPRAVEALADEIVSLARLIEDQKQQPAIAVEEASLALHFRKTHAQIVEALAVLERQGRTKRIQADGRQFFLF